MSDQPPGRSSRHGSTSPTASSTSSSAAILAGRPRIRWRPREHPLGHRRLPPGRHAGATAGAEWPVASRLVEDGTAFTACYSTCPTTTPAFTSMFTGRYPTPTASAACVAPASPSRCRRSPSGCPPPATPRGAPSPARCFRRSAPSAASRTSSTARRATARCTPSSGRGRWPAWRSSRWPSGPISPSFTSGTSTCRGAIPPGSITAGTDATPTSARSRAFDPWLGTLLSLVGDSTVVVFTGDHGENTRLEPHTLRTQELHRRAVRRLPVIPWAQWALTRGARSDSKRLLQMAPRHLWGHGQTLFEPLVRVPLVVPRGGRRRGPRGGRRSATSISPRRCSSWRASIRAPAGRGRAWPPRSDPGGSRPRAPWPWRSPASRRCRPSASARSATAATSSSPRSTTRAGSMPSTTSRPTRESARTSPGGCPRSPTGCARRCGPRRRGGRNRRHCGRRGRGDRRSPAGAGLSLSGSCC